MEVEGHMLLNEATLVAYHILDSLTLEALAVTSRESVLCSHSSSIHVVPILLHKPDSEGSTPHPTWKSNPRISRINPPSINSQSSIIAQVNEVADAATRCWWDEQHPGWMIFTLGNRHFETLEQIVQVRSQLTFRV